MGRILSAMCTHCKWYVQIRVVQGPGFQGWASGRTNIFLAQGFRQLKSTKFTDSDSESDKEKKEEETIETTIVKEIELFIVRH